jgi:aspartate kinase
MSEYQIMVKKFGGTSVGSIERIEAVADRLVSDYHNGQRPVVVASAMSGETNRLVNLANDINPRYRGPAYDMLLASGEQVSISLLSIALEKRGVKARPMLAYQLGILTDSLHSKAKIHSIKTDKLRGLVDEGIIPIIAGFQGMSEEQMITTLGRGGSDTSAVAIAAAMELDTCEIYTDVPAVCSADPRLVKKASELTELSFSEMMEMASLGSRVLHHRCVELAAKYKVKLHVRSTFETREGTWIMREEDRLENPVVTAVTHDASTVIIRLLNLPLGTEVLSTIFTALAEGEVMIDIIGQGQANEFQRLSFSITEEDLHRTLDICKNVLGNEVDVAYDKDVAKIAVVGVGMRNHPGVAAKFFQSIHEHKIPIHLVTTSDISISAVIGREKLQDAATSLHQSFGLDQD